MGVYFLSCRQLIKRISFTGLFGGSVFLALQVQRQYMLSRGDLFFNEYNQIQEDTNYYHSLHEQVMIGFDEKMHQQREEETGVNRLRAQLAGKAYGIVLETNIGTHRNYPYYQFGKIAKFIGVDWVQACVSNAEEKDPTSTIVLCDTNKLPFEDCSFDTVVDTFGLECSYDLARTYHEIKRMTKPGGRILLLERGLGFWMQDNFSLMQKCSVNLAARGQVYHHDFSLLIENDPEVIVLKKKRKMRGMIYYYELQKV